MTVGNFAWLAKFPEREATPLGRLGAIAFSLATTS
jgi:hypothetical protein